MAAAVQDVSSSPFECSFAPHIPFKQIVEALRENVSTLVFWCTEQGITILGVGSSEECISEIRFISSACKRYRCSPDGHIFAIPYKRLTLALSDNKKKLNNTVILTVRPSAAGAAAAAAAPQEPLGTTSRVSRSHCGKLGSPHDLEEIASTDSEVDEFSTTSVSYDSDVSRDSDDLTSGHDELSASSCVDDSEEEEEQEEEEEHTVEDDGGRTMRTQQGKHNNRHSTGFSSSAKTNSLVIQFRDDSNEGVETLPSITIPILSKLPKRMQRMRQVPTLGDGSICVMPAAELRRWCSELVVCGTKVLTTFSRNTIELESFGLPAASAYCRASTTAPANDIVPTIDGVVETQESKIQPDTEVTRTCHPSRMVMGSKECPVKITRVQVSCKTKPTGKRQKNFNPTSEETSGGGGGNPRNALFEEQNILKLCPPEMTNSVCLQLHPTILACENRGSVGGESVCVQNVYNTASVNNFTKHMAQLNPTRVVLGMAPESRLIVLYKLFMVATVTCYFKPQPE